MTTISRRGAEKKERCALSSGRCTTTALSASGADDEADEAAEAEEDSILKM